jgi:DNA-binding response OmpR family regulator
MMAIHVVHLEDDGPLRDILKVALKAAEPQIDLHQFISGDEAVRYIEQFGQEIDLFVLDIRVPGSLNGMQVAQKIRELKCAGTIVVTSAYRPPDRDLLNSLSCEWFPKPWHLMDTTQKLFQLARQRDGRRDTPPN